MRRVAAPPPVATPIAAVLTPPGPPAPQALKSLPGYDPASKPNPATLVRAPSRPLCAPGGCTASRSDSHSSIADPTRPGAGVQASNFYSVPEVFLLHWLTFHHNKVNATNPRRVTNFEGDLTDGGVRSHGLQLQSSLWRTSTAAVG